MNNIPIMWLIFLALICANADASHYDIDAKPWDVGFNSSLNLSFKVDANNNYTIVHIINGSGKEPSTFTIFTRSRKATNDTFNIFLNSYIKSNNITSSTKTPLAMEGTKGILAEGYSVKYGKNWLAAIWPYKPYFKSSGNVNWTSAILLLEGTLEPKDFQEIAGSLRCTKLFLPAGSLIRADPWIIEFKAPLNLTSKVDISPDYNIIHLIDRSDGEPATFTIFNSSRKATNDTLNIFLNSYIKSNNVTSPTKRAIAVDGTSGILAEGFSDKYGKNWHGAIWPYRPYFDPANNINLTSGVILLEGTLESDEFQDIIESLHIIRHYRLIAGPWIVEFNSTQSLKAKSQYSGDDESGTYWLIKLIDGASHEVAWFTLFSPPNLKSAASEFLDDQLNVGIELNRVTSPTKESVTIDKTEGRMAEGYSSKDLRYWRSIFYPYRPFFDSFTNTNMSIHRINFQSIQDLADYQEITDSLHIANSAEN